MTVDERNVRRIAADINARLEFGDDFSVTEDLAATYRDMAPTALVILRAAFTLDRDQARDSDQRQRLRAFCQSRIDLITALLGDAPAAGDSER